ncbi:MAG: DUF4352 domain-containing protein [Ancrocorticia sp.]
MSEENTRDPLNEASGSAPFQPTEPLPTAWQSDPAPQFPPPPRFGQNQHFAHPQQFNQSQQFAPPQPPPGGYYDQQGNYVPPQPPPGGYYDQQGNYVPPQYTSQSGQGGWNGGQPPQRSRGVPIWAWILLFVALSAIGAGVLFLTGVFSSSSDVTEGPTTAPASEQPTIPAPSPVTTAPGPVPTSPVPSPTTAPSPTTSPGQKPTVDIHQGSAVVGNWTLDVSEYNADATEALASGFLRSTPASGNKFIGVEFTFTNNGDAAADPFTDMFFTLMDDSLTTTYREEWALDRDDTVVTMDEVEVGKSGSGWVFFEVPKEFSGGILEIWDFSLDGKDVYLKIG